MFLLLSIRQQGSGSQAEQMSIGTQLGFVFYVALAGLELCLHLPPQCWH